VDVGRIWRCGVIVVFSTVVRSAPLNKGGEVVILDWATKEILEKAPVTPSGAYPGIESSRGLARGGRGVWVTSDSIYVVSYDQIETYDHRLVRKAAVSNGLLVDLHEVYKPDDDTIWVASTAIDGALEIDLEGGVVKNEYWPRDVGTFRDAFELEPSAIDKTVDQRSSFLDPEHAKQPSHLHLNALARYKGEMLALFNRFGAIVNLDRGEVVVRHKLLRGGHNLFVRGDEVITADTRGHGVNVFDLSAGTLRRSYPLEQYDWVHQRVRAGTMQRLQASVKRKLGRPAFADPLFVRGLDVVGDHVYVGFSPASIVCLDLVSGDLVDAYQYDDDVRVCVHGLKTFQAA
jgi:hypothetical protein